MKIFFSIALVSLVVLSLTRGGQPPASPATAGGNSQDLLPADARAAVDKAALKILRSTGAPSASIAVVKDGQLIYTQAYGIANIQRRKAATTNMRYSIGSISKQFTAAAILLLAEDGKLSLDDKVGRWLPEITRANEVSLRQLLSMTAGYQDYWPQDYVMPSMMQPAAIDAILTGWAGKPLDFEPGTKWQYSNTNYVIAGIIAERAAEMPLIDFLQKRIFTPLKIESVFNTDQAPLGPDEPMRYQRFALGPPRPAPKEGKGWMFAAGELAMTATDLAAWDISVINQTILKPASYREMETDVRLANGAASLYGLGVGLKIADGRRQIAHGGEVSGFTATNAIYPDDRVAVVVLTNLDATSASKDLTNKIADIVFTPPGSRASVDQAKKIWAGLQRGKIDRSLFTSNANAYFSKEVLRDLAGSLGPLGKSIDFSQISEGQRGGMTFHKYNARFAAKTFSVTTCVTPEGKFEQYIVSAD
jgi:D-alanyl-D-alanine carboxypeptidase